MKDGDWFMHLGQLKAIWPILGERSGFYLLLMGKPQTQQTPEWTPEGKCAMDSGVATETSSFSFKKALLSQFPLFLSKETDSRHDFPKKNLTWSSD